jgi:hypothetical protein
VKRLSESKYPVDEQYANLLTRIIGFQLVSDADPFFSRLSLNEKLYKSRMENDEAVTGQRTGMTGEMPTEDDVQVMQELMMAQSSSSGIIDKKRMPGRVGRRERFFLFRDIRYIFRECMCESKFQCVKFRKILSKFCYHTFAKLC